MAKRSETMLGEKLPYSQQDLSDDFDKDIQISFKGRAGSTVRAKLPTLAGKGDKRPSFTTGFTGKSGKNLPRIGSARALQYSFTPRGQRSVVKGSYSDKPASWRAHVRYLDREKANQEVGFFTQGKDEIPREHVLERVKEWENDPRVWKFTVSPENGNEMDLKKHVVDLVAELQTHLKRDVEWYAVKHGNTDHDHGHVLLRGVDLDGKEFMIAPALMRKMHEMSAELATQELGYRTEQEVLLSREKSIHAERFTELDRELVKMADKDTRLVDLTVLDEKPVYGHTKEGSREIQRQYFGRLKVLETMGLAERVLDKDVPKDKPTGYLWTLSPALEPALRQFQLTHDIVKRLNRDMTSMDPASSLKVHVNGVKEPIMGRIVSMGMDDELKDKRYVFVEGLDGHSHYIHQPNAMKLENAKEAYKPGHLIRLTPKEFKKGDKTIAYMKLENFGDTRNPEHLRPAFLQHVDEHLLNKNADLNADLPRDHPTRIQREMGRHIAARAVVLENANLITIDHETERVNNTPLTFALRKQGVIKRGKIVDLARWNSAVSNQDARKRHQEQEQQKSQQQAQQHTKEQVKQPIKDVKPKGKGMDLS